MVKGRILLGLAFVLATVAPQAGRAAPGACPTGAETWTQVGHETWAPRGLIRSQGVASDGRSWFFSWLASVERTDDLYIERAINTYPPQVIQPTFNPDGTNHVGPTHIGDIDVYNGVLYAPEEDGGQDFGPVSINNPEYRHPYVVLYDAETLAYKASYALPIERQDAGVPWVAVHGPANEVYTGEWGMPNDRINVYDLQMNPTGFIKLVYPPALGAGFRLNRIQGAKLLGGALYATRDDAEKSVFKIDIATGEVSKVFSINPDVVSEIEGIAIRPTPDGALMHILLVIHKLEFDPKLDFTKTRVQFLHYAVRCTAVASL